MDVETETKHGNGYQKVKMRVLDSDVFRSIHLIDPYVCQASESKSFFLYLMRWAILYLLKFLLILSVHAGNYQVSRTAVQIIEIIKHMVRL